MGKLCRNLFTQSFGGYGRTYPDIIYRGRRANQKDSSSKHLIDKIMNIKSSSRALSMIEASAYLGISERTLRRLKNNKEIRFSQIGKRIIFRPESLDAFLKEKEVA